MDFITRLHLLAEQFKDQYWAQRALQQIGYLYEVFCTVGKDIGDIADAFQALEKAVNENGAITKQDALETEKRLAAYQPDAKRLKLICAAHAHIDMNWQWGMDETVGIVIDTFQTMLDLMREYPQYIFTQSQAATYEMIEKYAPSMLPEIRQRVREGRWEVAATSWVEADKNMTNTESQIRHIQYTKKYLSTLLDLDTDTLELDFEPDTFGHGPYIPEVLARGGIKYYYHCRGNDKEELYRWRAPSGSEVIVLREPNWYLGPVTYDMAAYLPGFCARNGVTCGMRVYGVGDHGGGPTRRDIERILDMAKWPLMPEITFGRIDQFFHAVEQSKERFPVVERELNFIFTGCYTTQARIKQANRYGEDRLYDSEALLAMSKLAGCAFQSVGYDRAWKNVLFNQFHDILPGSCVRETREAALGMAQETNGFCIGNANRALYAMGQRVDTSAFGLAKDPNSVAEGAGTGYGTTKGTDLERAFSDTPFQVTQTSRGGGKIRAYTLFNPTQYDRREVVEMTVWDWEHPLNETSVFDAKKREIPFSVAHENKDYWRHVFCKLLFVAEVPAFGYATYYVAPATQPRKGNPVSEPRVHRMTDDDIVLENRILKATFSKSTMSVKSLLDKRSGQELLRGPAGFRFVEEQDTTHYSAWTIGAYGNTVDLNSTCFVESAQASFGGVRQEVVYNLHFRSSSLRVRVTLDEDSEVLRFSTEADWHETSKQGMPTPQLQFYVPYRYHADTIRYDMAGGFFDRPELGHDVPALLYASPVHTEGAGLYLTTDCKYGYRAHKGVLSVALLRSSHTPDHYPEHGIYQIEIGLGVCSSADWYALGRSAFCFSHPIFVYSNSLHTGELPSEGQFLKITGRTRITSLKQEEDGSGLILRGYQNDDCVQPLNISVDAKKAETVDLCEHSLHVLDVDGRSIRLQQLPWQIHSIKIELAGKG